MSASLRVYGAPGQSRLVRRLKRARRLRNLRRLVLSPPAGITGAAAIAVPLAIWWPF